MKKDIQNLRNGKQLQYILDCINISDYCQYENKPEPTEPADRVRYVLNVFNSEVNTNYDKRNRPSLQQRIEYWMRGCCCVSIDLDHYSIQKLGEAWGLCTTPRKTANFINNFCSVCAFRLLQLAKYYNIDTNFLY